MSDYRVILCEQCAGLKAKLCEREAEVERLKVALQEVIGIAEPAVRWPKDRERVMRARATLEGKP